MYHSIIDENNSYLVVNFTVKDEVVAVLKIAQTRGTNCRSCSHYPSYIDAKSSVNVDFITDKNEIDQLSPIQVYCGNDPALPSILLLEETEYDLELEKKSNRVVEELKYLFDNDQSLIIKPNRFGNSDEHKIYTFYSKSYVGKGFFDINIDDTVVKIPFEVRSKKIEYLNDYPQMLEDIAEFSSSMLLDPGSPLFRNYTAVSKTKETFYEDFLILDYIFGKCELEAIYEYVRNNRYSELRTDIREIVDGTVSSMDVSSVMDLLSSDNLIPDSTGVIAGQYNPIMIKGTYFTDTCDIPENRVVKDTLLTIQSMVYAVENSGIGLKSAYISDRLSYMKSVIDNFVADQWLSDIGGLTYIPYESTILHRRHGYSELFSIYQMLSVSVAFSQNDVSDLFEGHNKKVHYVYEYWCYVKLYNCLYKMSTNKPPIELTTVNKRKVISIRGGKFVSFSIDRKGQPLKVNLYYNKTFDQNDREFRSYSLKLRPDYTLVVNDGRMKYIINFDAKYKAVIKKPNDVEIDDSKINTGCWEYDIYKMHTYRDALIKSLGSYVLYPGNKDQNNLWERYIKPIDQEEWDNREGNVLPSVGAISLTPGSKKDNQLNNAIAMILDRIVAINYLNDVD